MKIEPIVLRAANAFVSKYHRHHKEVQGAKFAIALSIGDVVVGVAICGRPISRRLDNGKILEVTRLCVKEGVPNGCSKLYGACARIAKEMGYEKIITYILESEEGNSLVATGWQIEKTEAGGKAWNSSGRLIRNDTITNLFGTEKKYPNELKIRWSKMLNRITEP